MKIRSMGYNHVHNSDFSVDRPNGTECWLLLIIRTPGIFLEDGEFIEVKADSVVLYEPGVKQYYKAVTETYADDWILFYTDDEDMELFRKNNIQFNHVIHLVDVTDLSLVIRNMTYEHYSMQPSHEEINNLYFRILINKLHDRLEHNGIYSCKTNFLMKYQEIGSLRTSIFNSPKDVDSIDVMAQKLCMSRSGFQHTYKKLFSSSILNDIIVSRIEHAEPLLCKTDMTINDIAAECGYNSVLHFIRQFKQYRGCTPTEYRRNNRI